MRTWLVVLTALAATVAGGCKRGSEAGGGSGESSAAVRCAGEADRVRGIYQREAPPPGDGEGEVPAALARDLLEANVEMVLTDCERDPDRVLACIRRAQSVEQLEGECVIPLDDEGMAEERQFGGQ